MRELLMGNEAIAVGALAAGVQVVAGYPGTPSSEVLETIAKRNPGGVHVEWSVNEKAGAEVAAGAAYAGARAMVTMKQMGLNVASDPVMCVNYIGVRGGLVIYVADDPGPISSQTEQDTRHFGKYARIPVFDCDSPEQAFQAVQDAFTFSETHAAPVILRSTTRVCHACADIEVPDLTPPAPAPGFVKDSKWVIFPGLSYRNKQKLASREADWADLFSAYHGNSLEGTGPIGIACGGISYAYVKEALVSCCPEDRDRFRILKIATPYPFPNALADRFLEGLDQVMVFEELDPVIEDALIYRSGQRSLQPDGRPLPRILGKRSGTSPAAGELSAEMAADIMASETGIRFGLSQPAGTAGSRGARNGSADAPAGAGIDADAPAGTTADADAPAGTKADADLSGPTAGSRPVPDLPARPPVLCAGCPHRGAFYAVKQAVAKALRQTGQAGATASSGVNSDAPAGSEPGSRPAYTQAVYHGDIGCYTLGNAAPLNMVDTCLCMGAGITMAQGMFHADPTALNFAFAGDSTFFASGITGTVNAVYNQADIILCILDNSTTAMTGHQPHPGMGITMMGQEVAPVDIRKVLEGIGVPWIRTVDPLDYRASVETVTEAIGRTGVRAILFQSPCIALFKATEICRVEADRCVGCMRCINEIGCPALSPAAPGAPDAACALSGTKGNTAETNRQARPKALIDPALCNGCGLCAQLCPTNCIRKEAVK